MLSHQQYQHRINQLQDQLNQLILQRQAIDVNLLNQEAQRAEQERLDSLRALNDEYQTIENEIKLAWYHYNLAAAEEAHAINHPSFLDKLMGNEDNIKKLNKNARQKMKRINELNQQKSEIELSFHTLNQPTTTTVVYDDYLTTQIEQAQVALQQLQNEYAFVQNQAQQVRPIAPTSHYSANARIAQLKQEEAAEMKRRAEFDAAILASRLESQAKLAAELERINSVKAQPSLVAAPKVSNTAQPIKIATAELIPTQSQEELDHEMALALQAEFDREQQIESDRIFAEKLAAEEEPNYFDDEHIRAAKQKIRDEIGADSDIPDVCDLATLNQLTDDLYKHKHQSQYQNPYATPKPSPSAQKNKMDDKEKTANYLGQFALHLCVETHISLTLMIGGHHLVIEMMQLEMVKLNGKITQDRHGDVNFGLSSIAYSNHFGLFSQSSRHLRGISAEKNREVGFQSGVMLRVR